MMDFILDVMPWWGWLVVAMPAGFLSLRYLGFNATVALAVGAIALTIFAKGRKTGVAAERVKQDKADERAREVVREVKEDVRRAPREDINRRASRWEKP